MSERRSAHRRVLLRAAACLAVALPLSAAIWTRSTSMVRVSPGSRTPLPNATYVTREWNAAVTSFEVREGPQAGDLVSPKWLFYYRNTDAEQHYVGITVQCQDSARRDRAKFTYTATLQPNTKDEATVEIVSKMRNDDFHAMQFARVTIDFLSAPGG